MDLDTAQPHPSPSACFDPLTRQEEKTARVQNTDVLRILQASPSPIARFWACGCCGNMNPRVFRENEPPTQCNNCECGTYAPHDYWHPYPGPWAQARRRSMSHDEEALVGASDFVRIDRTVSGRPTVSVATVEWDGPHTPTLRWTQYDSKFAVGATDEEIIQAVMQDRRFFTTCSRCGEINNIGHMHSESMCQGCAERHLGVVY